MRIDLIDMRIDWKDIFDHFVAFLCAVVPILITMIAGFYYIRSFLGLAR